MRTNMTLYEGAFVNIETNTANENIQQVITLRLFDTETTIDNIYQALFRVANNGDGTQRIVFTYVLPDTVTTAAFGYEDGSGWSDIDLSFLGKDIFDIPQGDYSYSMIVDGDRIVFSAGETIPLEMAETPVVISVTDNTEDKFTPVKPKQADIQIHSSNTVDISNFADGGDNRFYVEIETQAEGIIFMGFLSVADLSQDFLPDPNIINLVATDGLGFLEDEPLVNFLGETPTEKQQIINFIVWALVKTGLALDVKVCMNIRQDGAVPLVSDDTGEGHFYKNVYLDSKTFEAEIGTCEDCFTVLEKIIGENSFITQYKGKWIIVRVDEMETGHEYFFTRFNWNGDFVEKTTETYSKDIGVNLPLSFMNDDAVVALDRPYKSIKDTFNYAYPKELVCNTDFSRGEFIEDLPDETIDDITYQVKKYFLDCWKAGRYYSDSPYPEHTDMEVYIKKYFLNDYEKQNFAVLTENTETLPTALIRSTPIPLEKNDRGSVSVDFKLAEVPSDTSVLVFGLMLIGSASGTAYLWSKPNNQWIPILTHSPLDPSGVSYTFSSAEEKATFNTASTEFLPIPESGDMYILLTSAGGPTGRDCDTYYSKLSVEITPFINGSYQQYSGQYNQLSQLNDKIKAVRDSEVFVSDAPRVAMKGALLKEGATTTLYSGAVSFTASSEIIMFADVTGFFNIGDVVIVTGSVSNDGEYTILNVVFAAIPGDTTTLTVNRETVIELTDPVTITKTLFVLASLFYNAAKLPAGPAAQSDLMLYGAIQSFDVWNQFNRVMRIFEATVDRTDSSVQLPDILHKYILRDINGNTTNGGTQYRIFMLLHFEMDLHLCEWGAFLHEVFNTDVPKIYEIYEFKYITEENA